jgi:(p)ppGpp synthase/HD superfamily hydrolase
MAELDLVRGPTFLQELPLVRRAFTFARKAHREQRRDSDAAQFIIHPLEVASLLYNAGHLDLVVAMGILHDTVEDIPAHTGEVEAMFGSEVAWRIAALTEDPGIEEFQARRAALRRQVAAFDSDAIAVYAADKVAKVRELRSRATRGEGVLERDAPQAHARLEHYDMSLDMLEEHAPHDPLVRQLRFELEMLHEIPPRPDLIAEPEH